ncbi:MAG TPA: RNA polymerase sigma factor [Chloroflexia bacterium]|nr:RNA polymerase sigma factor [Chloroflexia bacterium]
MDDAALVAGLQRGDPWAVEYVVQQYAPPLYRYAYYQVQDAMLAEDLVSEVMMRMIGSVDRFVLESTPFQAWLFRIARNLIADHYRARKRRPQVSLESWLAADPSGEPGGTDRGIDDLPDRQELQAGLATLTDEQRQVVLLHVVEGWELPQVARLLDRSLPSVKSLYYRGVDSLRRALTRGGHPPGRLPAKGT